MADNIARNPFDHIIKSNKYWKCQVEGCREHATKSGPLVLQHFFKTHLEKECPWEYTVYWCQYCLYNSPEQSYVVRHQVRLHQAPAVDPNHPAWLIGCSDCKISWWSNATLAQTQHDEVCSARVASNAQFRRWNRHTFRFDYPDNPIARDMLCVKALEPEPTNPDRAVSVVNQLEAALDMLPEDSQQLSAAIKAIRTEQLSAAIKGIRLRRDVMVRAHAIVRDEERLKMVEDDLHNLRTQQDLQLGRLSIDEAHFRPMPHDERFRATPEAGHSDVHSLSRSARLVSPRQRAIYFSPRCDSVLS